MTNEKLLIEAYRETIENIQRQRVEIFKDIKRLKEINESDPCRKEYGKLASLLSKIKVIRKAALKDNINV